MCLGFDMVEVEAQRLVKRWELGILLRVAFVWWWVFLLIVTPVVGLRPLRDRTNSWGDEICSWTSN